MTPTLPEPVRLALRAGWTVDNPDGPRPTITCPDGTIVRASVTAGPEAIERATARLRDHGLDEALATLDANRERTATRVQARRAEADAAEAADAARRTRRAQAAATAIGRAAGPYLTGPQDVPMAELLDRHPAPRMYLVTIGPAEADKLLAANVSNRRPSEYEVAAAAAEMRGGRWGLTHQGIALDTAGKLIDGQHRLKAIQAAGVAVPLMVFVGMPADSYAVIDTGRKRRAADVLHTDGWSHENQIAAMSRTLYLYENLPYPEWRRARVSNATLREYVSGLPSEWLMDAVRYGDRLRGGTKITTAAGAAFSMLVWKACGKDNPRMAEFSEGLITGAGLPVGDPRLKLRRNISNARETRTYRRAHDQLALTLKAWNAWAAGRVIHTLVWKATEGMPRVYVPAPDLP